MLVKLSNVLEIVGVVLVLVALAAIDWRLLVLAVGAVMVVVGYTIDPADDGEGTP